MTIPCTKTESPANPTPKRCCGPCRHRQAGQCPHWPRWDSPRGLFSENQPCPPTGFVKSQEGENEEGSEGELVVKFGETLPKVTQEQGTPRASFTAMQPAGLGSDSAP